MTKFLEYKGMFKTITYNCDCCNSIVESVYKCDICHRDICNNCLKRIKKGLSDTIFLSIIQKRFFNVNFTPSILCPSCYRNRKKWFEKINIEIEKVNSILIDISLIFNKWKRNSLEKIKFFQNLNENDILYLVYEYEFNKWKLQKIYMSYEEAYQYIVCSDVYKYIKKENLNSVHQIKKVSKKFNNDETYYIIEETYKI